ncbi:MAG: discoidin domain-containing protein [Armatimonadota bacterium]
MRHPYPVFTAVLCLWLLNPLSIVAQGKNLVTNGDFARMNEDRSPLHWRCVPRGNGTGDAKVDLATSYQEHYALKIVTKGASLNFEKRDGGYYVVSEPFPITVGDTYRLSFNIKTQGIKGIKDPKYGLAGAGACYITAIFYIFDEKKGYLTSKALNFYTDFNEFKNMQLEATIPEKGAFSHIQIWVMNFSKEDVATVWLNDVRVNRLTGSDESGRKLYTGTAESLNQHRERFLENYALLAGGATATASSVYGEGAHVHPAEHALDGNDETGWVGKIRPDVAYPYQLQIKLPAPKTIFATHWLRFKDEKHPDRAPEDYAIKVSTDGKTWQTVATVKGYKCSNRYDVFTPVTAQYVLMEITRLQTEGTSTNGPDIREFKVFGKKDGVTDDLPGWWNKDWHYRMKLTAPEGKGFRTVKMPLNFTQAANLTVEGLLEDSLRVVKTDGNKQEELPYRFLKVGNFHDRENAAGTLEFVVGDAPGAQYYCYFDTDQYGEKAKPAYLVAGVKTTPFFSTQGWGAKIELDPAAVEALTLFDDRGTKIAAVTPKVAADIPLSFSRQYYALVTTKDRATAVAWLDEPASSAFPAGLQLFRLKRDVFVRNEQIIPTVILNHPADGTVQVTASLAVMDEAGVEWYWANNQVTLGARETREIAADLGKVNLRPGAYTLALRLIGADKKYLAPPRQIAVTIVEQKPVPFIFGVGGPGAIPPDQWYATLRTIKGTGINTLTGNTTADFNDFLRFGIQSVGKIAWPFTRSRDEKYAARGEDGNPLTPLFTKDIFYPNYTDPIVRQEAQAGFKDYLAKIHDHPAFSGYVLMNDDYQLPCKYANGTFTNIAGYSDTDKALFKKLTGAEQPTPKEVTLKKGIIPDDDLWARFVYFRCKEVFGEGNNKAMVDAKNEIAPRVKYGQIHGPMQDNFYVPLEGLYPPTEQAVCDFVGGYTYFNRWREWKRYSTYGDLCRMGKVNRARGREMIMFSALNAMDGFTKTGEGTYQYDTTALATDWQIRNEFFQIAAGGFSGLLMYLWRDKNVSAEQKPELIAELTRIGALVKDYGPLLRNIHTSDKPVGIFVSITDSAYGQWFLSTSKHTNSNGAYLNDSFMRAHVPAETFSEEEVLDGILSKYKVVAIYDMIVMKQSIARKLEEYIKNGGQVIMARSKDIPLAGAVQLSTEAELVAAVKKAVTPLADTQSEEITIREFDDTKNTFLFFVDCFFDKYTATGKPEFFKKWQEKPFTITTQPRKEEIVLARTYAHAFDVFARKELPLTPAGNGCKFTLDFEPGGGKLVALYPTGVGSIDVVMPAQTITGNTVNVSITVRGKDGKAFPGVLPVKIDLYDAKGTLTPLGDSYIVRDGKLETSFLLPRNELAGKIRLVVTELVTGTTTEKAMTVLYPVVR